MFGAYSQLSDNTDPDYVIFLNVNKYRLLNFSRGKESNLSPGPNCADNILTICSKRKENRQSESPCCFVVNTTCFDSKGRITNSNSSSGFTSSPSRSDFKGLRFFRAERAVLITLMCLR